MGLRRKPSELNVYHVIARGTGKQLIFECDEDRNRFLSLFEHALSANNTDALAWCLMGNHIHLLIQENDEPIGDSMKRIASSYVYYYNHK